MKPAFTDVVANERLRTRLGTDLQSGTLSHAYILEGMPGSGKHTITLRIAAALACESGCSVGRIDVSRLRARLRQNGAFIE